MVWYNSINGYVFFIGEICYLLTCFTARGIKIRLESALAQTKSQKPKNVPMKFYHQCQQNNQWLKNNLNVVFKLFKETEKMAKSFIELYFVKVFFLQN